jgi:hypothetical protein
MQVHMPKLEQPKSHERGGVFFDAKRFVMAYCGQYFHKDDVDNTFRYGRELPLRMSTNLELVTCKRCLHSYSQAVIGGGRQPTRRPRNLREGLVQAIEARVASGIPLNEYDMSAIRFVAGVLKMESPV